MNEAQNCLSYGSDLDLSLMTTDDLKQIQKEYSNEFCEYKYRTLKNRIQDKMKRVYVVKERNKIAGYFCVSYNETYESGIKIFIPVDNASCYLFDDYVLKKYRGRGIHKFSVLARIKNCKKDEKVYAIVNIYRNNEKSRRNYQKLGFNRYISYYYIPLFKKLFVR